MFPAPAAPWGRLYSVAIRMEKERLRIVRTPASLRPEVSLPARSQEANKGFQAQPTSKQLSERATSPHPEFGTDPKGARRGRGSQSQERALGLGLPPSVTLP